MHYHGCTLPPSTPVNSSIFRQLSPTARHTTNQGSSVDGDDINSRASLASTAINSNPNTSPRAGRDSLNSPNASTPPNTSPERTSPPHATRGEGRGRSGAAPAVAAAASAVAAAAGAAESGPWGRGSQEDALRSAMEAEASTTEDMGQEEEVPQEPDAGEGVRTCWGGGVVICDAGVSWRGGCGDFNTARAGGGYGQSKGPLQRVEES